MNYVLVTETLVFLLQSVLAGLGCTELSGQTVFSATWWLVVFIVQYLFLMIDTGLMCKYARDDSAPIEGSTSANDSLVQGYHSHKTMFRFAGFSWLFNLVVGISLLTFFIRTGYKTVDRSAVVISRAQNLSDLQWAVTMAALFFSWPIPALLYIDCLWHCTKQHHGTKRQ